MSDQFKDSVASPNVEVPEVQHRYCPGGPVDKMIKELENSKLERDMELIVKRFSGKSDEEIAVELVKKWKLRNGYGYLVENSRSDSINFHFVSGLEAYGLGPKYLEKEYWKIFFQENKKCKESFWSEQFQESGTTCLDVQISNYIPDDPVHRMVLHYLRSWRLRLSRYVLNEKIALHERKLVLTKQIENFSFISRKQPFGSLWKMNSEPNTMLQQALDNIGIVTNAMDEKGEPAMTITGRKVTVWASENFSKTAAAGPSPDKKDKQIYNYICKYASSKLEPMKVHRSWTMVKGSFKYNGKSYRCYAFSGQQCSERNRIPLEWWKKRSGPDAWDDDDDVQFVDGSTLKIANSLVLSLFKACRFDIEEDLKKLALYIAYEKSTAADTLIRHGRRDGRVIDYGIFYDFAMKVVNDYVVRIQKAMLNILKRVPGFDEMSYLCCLTVGWENQQFKPKKEKVKDLLSKGVCSQKEVDTICENLCKMSESHLGKLKKELDRLPRVFLDTIEKQIKTFKCGEDNVIDMVLSKLLQLKNCDALMNIEVQFVALDKDHQDGKKFCGECAEKVKFYSILPILLRDTGFTGDDFPKLAPLLETEAACGSNKDDPLI